jgi:FliI/YscN family ATPase
VAEYFRDRGADVLLLMDSLTRLGMAQRQIGLVSGEPAATRGYPPSVFNLLPEVLERAGRTRTGSITGFYSVLVEGDDMADPIADAARSVTDGHVWLSRDLANRGQYPAVDVLASVSRVMMDVTGAEHQRLAADLRRLMALHAEVAEMVQIGAYQHGASAEHDAAIAAMPRIRALLAQRIDEPAPLEATMASLRELCAAVAAAPGRYEGGAGRDEAPAQRIARRPMRIGR